MGLNDTPSSERLHIGFFGRRNAGKSSVVNAVTGQEMAVVSEMKGTTTDPVQKSMELLPVGPVVIIDTPGFDDEGALGEKRVRATRRILNRTDLAILIVDALEGTGPCERELIALFKKKNIPYIIAMNKSDLLGIVPKENETQIWVSAKTGDGIYALKEKMAKKGSEGSAHRPLIEDLLCPGDIVLLVIPIDKAAPKGRLILPQQMMIRAILDADGIPVCVKEDRIGEALANLTKKPRLVVTDSQVFERVAREVPQDIEMTSFSILMARYKGFLDEALRGAAAIADLKEGDRVLISEGCTHHRQCGDIGTVKLPAWLRETTGAEIAYETSSGHGFPDNLHPYSLVIHCGACMLGDREVLYRMKCAQDQGVPFTNYGTAIAQMKGILLRSTRVFDEK